MKYWVLSFLCVFISAIAGHTQQLTPAVIASEGGTGYGYGIQLDYTIGELAVDRLTGQPVSITEGYHQPILLVENVESSPSNEGREIREAFESMISLTPNPVKSELTIKFGAEAPESIALDVRDANGKLVLQKQFDLLGGDTPLDVSGFLPGIYYFHFSSPNHPILSTFKISKI